MGIAKISGLKKNDILRFESELNNLWGELNTSNIPHALRMELERTLTRCEEQFRESLSGQTSFKELETNLKKCDLELAKAAITQAENELPKSERCSSCCLALENIRKELDVGKINPVHARHEVKQVMRHHA